MPKRPGFCFILVVAAILGNSCTSGNSPLTPPPPAPEPMKIVLGYYAGFLAAEGYASVTTFTSYLSAVSADVFAVTAGGAIDGASPADLLSFDKANHIRTFACISNYGESDFDSALGHSAVVTNKTLVIANMVDLARSGDWEGINVDFENLYPSDRDAFSSFIHDLAGALHEKGLKLLISVPAKSTDDPDDDWSWPFAYPSLGADADVIQLMTYDEHGPWSDPGSVAGFAWLESCVQYAVSVIDPAKLLLGLPAYGYDWNLTDPDKNSDFAWKEVPGILASTGATPMWDSGTKSVYITYKNSIGTTDGSAHVAWFETAAGIAAKTALR